MHVEYAPEFERHYRKLSLTSKKKAEKQVEKFLRDPWYPSLHVEKLEPRSKQYWSLRIDKKYRIIFRYLGEDTVLFVGVGEHDWIYKYTNRL
jgi:toxin HigB-1